MTTFHLVRVIHDGVEEAREEDDPAIRACREEAGPGSARLV